MGSTAEWRDREKGITLTKKKGHSQKVPYCMFPFIEQSGNDKIIEMENRLETARGESW